MGRILVIDDEPNMRRILASHLQRDGHAVSEADGVQGGTQLLANEDFDVVITDQKMPDGTGLDVLAVAHESDPAVSVVMLTAVATVELAVEAMRQGAFDFLTKPFQPDVVLATARRACERTSLLRENQLLKKEVTLRDGVGELAGESGAMRNVRGLIEQVAPTNATVLITGETGTGKELVARAIHRRSPRAAKPFVAVNCAAFPETLLESELFGHERGAFTGADRSRQGLFEAAHEGTLFLDEAGEMSPAAQAKLLRILVDGQLTRVGSTKPRTVDVRVLVATHRNLQERVNEGQFRDDLYYRLAVFPIHIPPLRERQEDIPGLCELFCRRIASDMKLPARPMPAAVAESLKHYAFPGNARELRNLIERAYILSRGGHLEAGHFPSATALPVVEATVPAALPETLDLTEFLERTEKEVILRALEAGGGVQAEAARRLGLSRSALAYKLTKYGIRTTA
jgi:DNA-binding NtrC family response regulator